MLSKLHRQPRPDFDAEAFTKFRGILSLKELLVYSSSEIGDRFVGYMNQVKLMKQKAIAQVVREFVASELYIQRTMLVQLLLKGNLPEYQYLAYLLYDLLSNDTNGSVDSRDQVTLFDSFPWNIRRYFKEAMQQTVRYTQDLSNFETSRIPLEQQICLLKANDGVKEKAMLKLKEVKAKSEDSGSKARQFLEGLLRIPFGIYRHEPILSKLKETCVAFKELKDELDKSSTISTSISLSDNFTSLEMRKCINAIREDVSSSLTQNIETTLIESLTSGKRAQLVAFVLEINGIVRDRRLKRHKLIHSGKNLDYIRGQITTFIKSVRSDKVTFSQLTRIRTTSGASAINETAGRLPELLNSIDQGMGEVSSYLTNTRRVLDKSVHGHDKAKRQIETHHRSVDKWEGQWLLLRV